MNAPIPDVREIRIIALDLDGTLLDSEKNLPEANRAALARAAVATGVDGVFMETHMNPKVAKSDAAHAIKFSEVEKLWKTLLRINEIVK